MFYKEKVHLSIKKTTSEGVVLIMQIQDIRQLVFLFVIMFTSLQIGASDFAISPDEATLNEEIQEAGLIIKAKLINKYYSEEEIIARIGFGAKAKKNIVIEMFTTFNFSVVDVLKGKYASREIKVSTLGGCYDNGVCTFFSDLGYDYEENEEAVLFLIPRELDTSLYRTTHDSRTAFFLDDEKILRRKSKLDNDNDNAIILNSNNKFMINNEYRINYEELKAKINEVESNESH